ncbi:MAG: LruC domain-containing protein [Bacteroidetes bacterium]|nr:LruC domain-containing protein [Bacteroidota bacterium]
MKKPLLIVSLFCLLLISNITFSQSVSPIIENVTNYGNGYYFISYGYNNTSGSIANIPVNNGAGVRNFFTPGVIDRGQPTTYQIGRQIAVWGIWVQYGTSLTWNLTGRTATNGTKNITAAITDNSTVMPPIGGQVTYTIKYSNNESSGLSNGKLVDTIPAGTQFVSATGGGVSSGNAVTWNIGSMNGQTSGTVTVTIQVVALEAAAIGYRNVVYFSGQFNGANYRAFGYDDNIGNPTRTTDSSYIAAFEDLKGSGWNDWDVNDFVVGMRERVTFNNSNQITQIVFDYEALARGSAYVNQFLHFIKIPGNSTATLVVKDSNGVVLPSLGYTNQNFTDAVNTRIFPNTYNALPPKPGRTFSNVEKAQVGIIKGYTATLTITTDPNSVNSGNYVRGNSRPYLINEINKQIDIASLAGTLGNTQNVDNNVDAGTRLYGYFLDLAYRLPYNWKWPLEGPPSAIWRSFPYFNNYILSSKTVATDWYVAPDTSLVWNRRVVPADYAFSGEKSKTSFLNKLQSIGYSTDELILTDSAGSFFSSPKLADIDNDNKLEILIGSYDKKFHAYKTNGTEVNGFPVTTTGLIRSTAAVYLNPNGSRVIAFGSDDGKLYAVDKNGANLPGFPVQTPKAIKSSPMIVDLNNDGQKEIVVLSGDGKMYAYSFNGTALSGFPVQVQNTEDNFGNIIIMPSPAAVDLDGNGTKEIVIGTLDKTLKVLNSDGSVRFTKTLDSAVYSSPLIAKINSSTYRIIVATASGSIYVYDNAGNLVTSKNLGSGFISSPVLADLDKSGTPQLIAATIDGTITKLNAVTLATMWELPTGQQIYSSPVIADIDGDNYLDIIYGGQNGFLLPLTRQGYLVDSTTMAAVEPFDSWIISTSAIGDIDKDGKIDLVAASMDNKLKAFSLPGTSVNTKVWWGSFGNDLGNTRVADSLTSVGIVNSSAVADKYLLGQNYPNPFNPTTKISFSLPKNEFVSVKVFDMSGKEIAQLVNNEMKTGVYEYQFDGSKLASGVYFYRITTPNFTETKKMTLVK